jgi:hypothetical protein
MLLGLRTSSQGSILGSVKQKVAGLLGAKQASLGAMFQDGFGSSMTVLESTMGEIRVGGHYLCSTQFLYLRFLLGPLLLPHD